jgi:HPt (histidine-containing phosphotransfer) domain-containing protein
MARLTGGAGATAVSRSAARPAAAPATGQALNARTIDELEAVLGAAGVAKLLHKFRNNLTAYCDQIRAAHRAGDADRVAAIAHALRGLTAQFGAERVMALAQAIEVRRDTPAEVGVLLADLEVAVADAAERTAARLAPDPASANGGRRA